VPQFYFPNDTKRLAAEQMTMDEAVTKVFEKGPIKDLAPVCD